MKEEKYTKLPDSFTVTAHTGCGNTKSNSLDSIDYGSQQGAQIVEFDLRYTVSGVPILSHDATLNEVGVVSFERAIARVAEYPDLKVNIDVKDISFLRNIMPILEAHDMKDRVFFTGLGKAVLPRVANMELGIPFYLNIPNNPFLYCTDKFIRRNVDFAAENGAVGINVCKSFVTETMLKYAREKGLLVSIWTVKEKDVERYLRLLPDNITTKEPKCVFDAIKRLHL